jgi:hypothetical protein
MSQLRDIHAIPEAVDKIGRKTAVPAALSAKKWSEMPIALRERAFFSAKVTEKRALQEMQDRILVSLRDARKAITRPDGQADTVLMTKDRFISEMREIVTDMGLGPTGPQTIEDIRSAPRLGLIFDMAEQSAYGYAQRKIGLDEDVLNIFPAQRLVRIQSREVPRGYKRRGGGLVADPDNAWPERWRRAGESVGWEGALPGEDMVALKTSPIWTALNAFGTPWPPFDFNSGMGLKDVRRDEAEALGLVDQGRRITGQAADERFNRDLEASVSGLDERKIADIRETFGDLVEVDGDRVRWVGEKTDAPTEVKPVQKPVEKPADVSPVKKTVTKADKEAKKTNAEEAMRKKLEPVVKDFQSKTGVDAVEYKAPARVWGRQIKSAGERIALLKNVASENDRLRKAFPNMPKKPTRTFYAVSSRRGYAHIGGPGLSVKSKEWSNQVWDRVEAWEKLNGKRWGTERRGHQVADNYRHELAHNMSTTEVVSKWKALVSGKYSNEWFRENVSQYAGSHKGDASLWESLAESFGLATRENYQKGMLPKDIEDFIFKIVLGET